MTWKSWWPMISNLIAAICLVGIDFLFRKIFQQEIESGQTMNITINTWFLLALICLVAACFNLRKLHWFVRLLAAGLLGFAASAVYLHLDGRVFDAKYAVICTGVGIFFGFPTWLLGTWVGEWKWVKKFLDD